MKPKTFEQLVKEAERRADDTGMAQMVIKDLLGRKAVKGSEKVIPLGRVERHRCLIEYVTWPVNWQYKPKGE